MRGWKSSSSTRRRDRAYEQLAAAAEEVRSRGRAASVRGRDASFWVPPADAPPLARFDDGVAPALRNHLADQGLDRLAETVDDLAALGRRYRGRSRVDHTVSDVVYQMH